MKKQSRYNIRLFILLIIIIYCVNGFSRERYYNLYPTINIYPDNYTEVKLVEKFVSEKTIEMKNFIIKTDGSVAHAFKEIVPETIEDLTAILSISTPIIIFFKILFNRARPKQIDPELDIFQSTTASTPSFPSGHTCQGYYLAKKLSEKYPEKRDILFELAEKCGQARIYAGLHYPSDHQFSKLLVDFIL